MPRDSRSSSTFFLEGQQYSQVLLWMACANKALGLFHDVPHSRKMKVIFASTMREIRHSNDIPRLKKLESNHFRFNKSELCFHFSRLKRCQHPKEIFVVKSGFPPKKGEGKKKVGT